ncbi:MAG: hypothetical protein ACMG57_02205 [Candidatus Dojkabacteria bacterium]
MEQSTQPQPAIPSKVFPTQTTITSQADMPTEELNKKKTLPFIISIILFFLVIAVLLVLLFLTNKPTDSNNQPVVSAPVTQTTAAPETSGNTTPTIVPDTTANTFESRLFYLGFDYSSALASDTTTRVTNADGTTWCFTEEAAGQNITVSVLQGPGECQGAEGGLGLETIDQLSADGKTFKIVIKQDTKDASKYNALIRYYATSPLPLALRIDLTSDSQASVKADAIALVKTLSFDDSKLKSELTDVIR